MYNYACRKNTKITTRIKIYNAHYQKVTKILFFDAVALFSNKCEQYFRINFASKYNFQDFNFECY